MHKYCCNCLLSCCRSKFNAGQVIDPFNDSSEEIIFKNLLNYTINSCLDLETQLKQYMQERVEDVSLESKLYDEFTKLETLQLNLNKLNNSFLDLSQFPIQSVTASISQQFKSTKASKDPSVSMNSSTGTVMPYWRDYFSPFEIPISIKHLTRSSDSFSSLSELTDKQPFQSQNPSNSLIYTGKFRNEIVLIKQKAIKPKTGIFQLWSKENNNEFIPNEVKILKKLSNCKGSVQIIDYFTDLNLLTIVFKYEESAVDLGRFFNNYTVPDIMIKKIFEQLVDACIELKQHKVMHLDLNIGNAIIYFDKFSGKLNVKLIGFSSAIDHTNDELNRYTGTALNAPPEWCSSKKNFYGDALTVWQLGIILFTLTQGEHPFDSTYEITEKDITLNGKDLIYLNRNDLINKCLQRNFFRRIGLEGISEHRWLCSDDLEFANKFNAKNYGLDKYDQLESYGSLGFRRIYRKRNAIQELSVIEMKRQEVSKKELNEMFTIGSIFRAQCIDNFVELVDYCVVKDKAYYIMEALNGYEPISIIDFELNLKEKTEPASENGSKMNEDEMKKCFAAVLDTCIDLFKRKLMPLFLKPDKILYDRKKNHVKFYRTEYAVTNGEALTKESVIYMPPEKFQKGNYESKEGLVWQFGMLIFELVWPKEFNCLSEYIQHQMTISPLFYLPPIDISTEDKSFSLDFYSLVSSCLKSEPDKRITLGDLTEHNWLKMYMRHMFHEE